MTSIHLYYKALFKVNEDILQLKKQNNWSITWKAVFKKVSVGVLGVVRSGRSLVCSGTTAATEQVLSLQVRCSILLRGLHRRNGGYRWGWGLLWRTLWLRRSGASWGQRWCGHRCRWGFWTYWPAREWKVCSGGCCRSNQFWTRCKCGSGFLQQRWRVMGGDGLWTWGGGRQLWWFDWDVELDVISVTVEEEPMMACDVAREKHVEDEEKWTKHWTLRDAWGRTRGGGGDVVDVDELMPVTLSFITAAFHAFSTLIQQSSFLPCHLSPTEKKYYEINIPAHTRRWLTWSY